MKNGETFWRENKIDCGDSWRAVEIFQYSDRRCTAARKKRKAKAMMSSPAQQNLNEKRARRYLLQLILANFEEGDYIAHNTYADKYLPENGEAAGKLAKRFLDRISYALKKRSLPPLKYVCITSEGTVHGRFHHHIFLSCKLSRDEIEDMWWAVKGTKSKKREMLGGINVDRLKDWTGDGIYEMAKYVTRQAKGRKKWTQSQNLKKPKMKRANDTKYRRKTMELVMEMDEKSEALREFIQKNYPGYAPVQIEKVDPNIEYCWGGGIYLLLRKICT